MYHHVKNLKYTVRVDEPDLRFGTMLLELHATAVETGDDYYPTWRGLVLSIQRRFIALRALSAAPGSWAATPQQVSLTDLRFGRSLCSLPPVHHQSY
jgi:hypothetical protein